MKNKFFLLLLFQIFGYVNGSFVDNESKEQKHIVLITATYNSKDWCIRNLEAAFAQAKKYSNYDLYYCDDHSSDENYELVEKYINNRGYKLINHFFVEDISEVKIYKRPKVSCGPEYIRLIHNKKRRRALANQYDMIHACKKTDICIIYDGDDFFEKYDCQSRKWKINPDVLSYINGVYSDTKIWLTYGQFREWPSCNIGFCCPYPKNVIESNGFRKSSHGPSHLRTFVAGLFQKIKKEDLMYKDDFFQMTCDLAAMLPMIEMASKKHFKFISKVLLAYNAANSLNCHKVSKGKQRSLDLVIRARKRYDPIDSPF